MWTEVDNPNKST